MPRSYPVDALANAVLNDLRAEPGTPISAHDLGELIGLSGREISFPLRALAQAGLATKQRVSPGSTRQVWSATDIGRRHQTDLTGINQELQRLEARRESRAP